MQRAKIAPRRGAAGREELQVTAGVSQPRGEVQVGVCCDAESFSDLACSGLGSKGGLISRDGGWKENCLLALPVCFPS